MPSAMICIGSGLDHAELVEPQRVEPHRVLRVVIRAIGRSGSRSASGARNRSPAANPPSTRRCATRFGSAAQRSAALRMARSTRFVATGLLRTKCALPASTQQKYCDHGRSTELSTITRPTFRACSSCGSGGNPRNASILPSLKSSIGFTLALVTQLMSLAGSSPTWASHDWRGTGRDPLERPGHRHSCPSGRRCCGFLPLRTARSIQHAHRR